MTSMYRPPTEYGPRSHRAFQAGDLRVSDADRDAAVAHLGQHHAQGRLDAAEWTERIDRAYQARTHSDLDALFSDLPYAPTPAAADPARRRRRALLLAAAALLVAALVAVSAVTGRSVIFAGWWLLWLAWFASRRWRRHPYAWAARGNGGWRW